MKTKYILVQLLSQATKTFETDKVVRFATGLNVRLIRVNNDREVVVSFDEDVRQLELNEDRTDIYVKLHEWA